MKTILVCTNHRYGITSPSCGLRGSEKTLSALTKAVQQRGMPFEVKKFVCMGHCSFGPTVRIQGGPIFHGATPDRLDALIEWLEAEQ